MTQPQAEYKIGISETEDSTNNALAMLGTGYDEQKAAIIERPRTVCGIGEGGLEEYQLFGWVKMSAKFCRHIKKLRGAKLAIWLCLSLNIDEDGKCNLTQKELREMTGYSHTEVINSVNELDEMGFLSVDRSGKSNLYQPVFVAKGKGNSPSQETLVKKLESTGLDSLESSPSYKNSVPTSSKKEKDMMRILLGQSNPLQEREQLAINAFESAFGITRPWSWYPARTSEEKTWKDFRAYVVELFEADCDCFTKYVTWTRVPYAKGTMSVLGIKRNPQNFPDSWVCYLASSSMYGDKTQNSERNPAGI